MADTQTTEWPANPEGEPQRDWTPQTAEIQASLEYFRRMHIEPTPYGILRWMDRQNGNVDHKYARRLMDALVRICGGNPDAAYCFASGEDWEKVCSS